MATAIKTAGVVCDERELARALAHCKKVVSRRAVAPALGAVRLWRRGDELMMEAVDAGRVAVRCYLLGEVSGRFDARVPLEAWVGALKSLKGSGPVTLAQAPKYGMKVAAGRRRLTLPGVEEPWPGPNFDAEGDRLIHAIGSQLTVATETIAVFAGQDTGGRPLLPCAHIADGEMWATDTYMLGCVAVPGWVGDGPAVRVDAGALAQATAHLEDDDGAILEAREHDVLLRVPGRLYALDRVEGDWDRTALLGTLPMVLSARVDYDAFYEAIAGAAEVLADAVLGMSVDMTGVHLAGRSEDGGTFKQTVKGDVTLLDAALAADWAAADNIAQDMPRTFSADDARKYAEEANAKLDARARFELRPARGKGRFRLVAGLPPRHALAADRFARLLHVMDADDEVLIEVPSAHELRPIVVRSGPDWAVLMPRMYE